MKRFLSALAIIAATLISIANFTSSAQETKKQRFKPLNSQDTSYMEVVYVHITFDPVVKEKEVKYEMLTLGEKINHYGGYGNFQLDSIMRFDPQLERTAPTFEDYQKLCRELEDIDSEMTINHSDSMINYYSRSFVNYYRYIEPIPKIAWTLEEEEEVILGHTCKKASAKWRGRDWTAWYSEIPVDAGPWKFQGLPGLILKLFDSKNEHTFEAIGFKNEIFPFGYHTALHCKTTREKFNEIKKEDKWHIGRQMLESGMIIPQSKEEEEFLRNRRLFYNPIELE